jgi:hypothetical protein
MVHRRRAARQPDEALTDADCAALREWREDVITLVTHRAPAPHHGPDARYPVSDAAPSGRATDEELRDIGRYLAVESDERGDAKRK